MFLVQSPLTRLLKCTVSLYNSCRGDDHRHKIAPQY